MKRYEIIVKIETIRALLKEGEYVQAQMLADEIAPEKLKKRGDVHVLAQAYKMNEKYEIAQALLLRLYEERASRRLLEELLELSLLQKDIETAEKYFEKYQRVSGGDPANYIYEYRIGRLKGKAYEELLPLLQTLKDEQYMEKYAYELAKVYHKLGRSEECLAECSDLILWFGEGRYVEKAKALQAYYTGEIQLDEIRSYQSEQESVTEYGSFRVYAEPQPEEVQSAVEPPVENAYYEVTEEQPMAEPEEQDTQETDDAEEPMSAYERLMREAASMEEDTGFTAYEEIEQRTVIEEAEPDLEMPQERTSFEEVSYHTEYGAEDTTEAVSEEPMSAYERLMREAASMEEEEITSEENAAETEMAEEVETIEEQPSSQAEHELLQYLESCGISLEDTLHTFANIPSVRSQLLQGLDALASTNPACYCMVVAGERKCGKTTFGKDIVKLLYQLSWLKRPKVAVITGTKMNEISLEEKKAQLQGCCLIIEKAGRMSEETVSRLVSFIQNGQTLGMVILEDRDKRINYLMRNHLEWDALFSVRVQLPKYTIDDLFGFAMDYVKEQDYSVEEGAEVALYEKIADLVQIEAGEGRLLKTLQIAKDALEKAEERNQTAILNMVEHGNFSANDVLTLKSIDFL